MLLSLVAEPLTGLVDTAFVSRLGEDALAALGAATALLSMGFWVFNFLGIGTQTMVAQAVGAGDDRAAREAAGVALTLAAGIGLAIGVLLWWLAPWAAQFMGATGAMRDPFVDYLVIRLLSAPAVLITAVGFGALRGRQDMVWPMWIAIGLNVCNVALDPLLIWGAGPIPAMGIAGAAWASTVSQWLGAAWVLHRLWRGDLVRLGFTWRRARGLLVIGRDMVIRTACLTGFMLLATRAATRVGADAGAAHQVVRQVWFLSALALDAFAATGQSLVGFFLGAGQMPAARHVARVVTAWSLATGVLLTLAMLVTEDLAIAALVPAASVGMFHVAWLWAAWLQPVSALSFITDGIHWGTGDFRFLRNAMLLATGTGVVGLALFSATLEQIWAMTAVWLAVRAALGVLRIWPGIGEAPLRLCGVVPRA